MKRFPQYELTETILERDGTLLCRARAVQDQRPVLLKLVKSEHPSPKDLAKLRHEYAITRELDVPGVVQVSALERHGIHLVLVMADFDGRTLHEVIQAGRLGLRAALRIAASLAGILASIHGRGVIHKDIQPRNILLRPETLEVKLTNFSIATRLTQEIQRAVGPDSLEGSLAYMSPEQTGRMNRSLDRRTDLYSFGVTLYELLTGVLPFRAEDPMRLVHSHIARIPAPPHEVSPEVPGVVSELVMKLLSKSAESRYQHAYGLAADLEECLARLDASGQIASFPLGRRDIGDELRLPQKLYGRDAEVAVLLAAWDRATTGAVELLLVSGYAGVGKSALVNEIHKALADRDGYFIAGKFDQFNRSVPYAPIAHALRELVRCLISEREEVLSAWRDRILQAVGPNGQLLVDLIPELSMIIGPQPRVPELGPSESQNRFNLAFQSFLLVFAAAEHPLALFLDDLQWADPASLKLLQHLVLAPGGAHLLVIGAYRDDDVDAAHPLSLMRSEIRKRGASVTEIVLNPLAPEHVNELVAEALGCDEAIAAPLSEIVLDKTHGNPFFVGQFLASLHKEGWLTFDPSSGLFSWDLDLIREKTLTDDVDTFTAARLKRLAPATQRLLFLAACLGHRFDLRTLSLIHEKSPRETAAELWESLREGLVLPLDSDYRFAHLGDGGAHAQDSQQLDAELNISYKFLHDRIQQAAYALLEEDRRRAVHLRIGRLLLGRSGRPPRDEDLFDIVGHLNRGAALIDGAEERMELVRMNRIAGKRAKDATAYEAAAGYLEAGMDLLGEGGAERDGDLSFALTMELAECEYLSGRFEEADRLFDVLLARAASDLDRARVQNLRMVLYITQGRVAEAVSTGRAALSLFGIDLPPAKEARTAAFEAELVEVPSSLRGRRIEDLYDAPEMTDPVQRMILELLTNLDAPAYQTDPALHALVVAKKVNLSLRYGHSDLSAFAYMTHGWTLASRLGRYEEGVAFGELALRLNEKFNNVDLTCKLNGIFGSYTHFTKPLRSRIGFLRKAYRAGLVSGDFPYLSYNCFHTVLVRLGLGDELGSVREEIDTFFAVMKRTRDAPSTAVLTLAKQIIANLKGQTRDRRSLSDDSFDEAAFAAANDGSGFIACAYYTARTELLFLHGDLEGALIASSLAEPRVASSGGFYYTTELSFYTCLTLLGLPPAPTDAERAQRAARLADHRAKLAQWAHHCPANYRHAHLLVLAEAARASGDDLTAMDLYDQAILSAGADGFPHHAAMANELAARFYQKRGQEKVAEVYLKEACAGYRAWGAAAKVADLEERYESLRSPHGAAEPPPVAGAGAIDLLAVIGASQALSSEIDLRQLLRRLMTSALESAGAERGCLLRGRGDDLRIEAEAFVQEDEVVVSLHGEAPRPLVPPESIMNYVKKTQEVLILDNAAIDPRFAWDEQVTAGSLQSVLCVPLMRQAVRVGVLYLENNLTTGAFVRSRVAVLELLASQAAISLENAVLYEELRQENEERRRAEAALSEKLDLIERQQETIRVLSTPIIEVWDGVLTVPVLGVLDERRAAELMQSLLEAVTRRSCRYAILDLTGVESVDEATAAHILKLVGALRLVGARGIVVGIQASVARNLVSTCSELTGITTLSNLRQALVFCVRRGGG